MRAPWLYVDDVTGAAIVSDGRYAYDVQDGGLYLLTLHPKTGELVRESSLRWPDDYPAREIARCLREWYGPGARARAVALGAWESEMILAERSANEKPPAP